MKVTRKRTSRCPSCGEKISIGERAKIGQYLVCSICDEMVEIVRLDPIVLDWLYQPGDNGHYYDDEIELWDRIHP
jgi:hypothetical protein